MNEETMNEEARDLIELDEFHEWLNGLGVEVQVRDDNGEEKNPISNREDPSPTGRIRPVP